MLITNLEILLGDNCKKTKTAAKLQSMCIQTYALWHGWASFSDKRPHFLTFNQSDPHKCVLTTCNSGNRGHAMHPRKNFYPIARVSTLGILVIEWAVEALQPPALGNFTCKPWSGLFYALYVIGFIPFHTVWYEIGRAHVWTPVTWNDLVCRLLLEKKKQKK